MQFKHVHLSVVLAGAGVNCNAMDATNPGLGEDLDAANAASDAMDQEFKVNFQYKVVTNTEKLTRITADDIAEAIKFEFRRRQQWLLFLSTLMKRALAFTFLNVIWRYVIH